MAITYYTSSESDYSNNIENLYTLEESEEEDDDYYCYTDGGEAYDVHHGVPKESKVSDKRRIGTNQ